MVADRHEAQDSTAPNGQGAVHPRAQEIYDQAISNGMNVPMWMANEIAWGLEGTTPTDLPETWQPVDWEEIYKNGWSDPPPSILERADGTHLLYEAAVNTIAGEPESGKSWFALLATAQTIQAEKPAVYIDVEDNPARIAARLRALGCGWHHINRHLTYMRPDEPATDIVVEHINRINPTLLVIDALTEYIFQQGQDINDNTAVAGIISHLPRLVAAEGTSVLLLDHRPKVRGERDRFAIGAQHKLAAVSGAAYTIETRDPFNRTDRGWARIYIVKDRPGHIRGTHTHMEKPGIHAAADFIISPNNTDQLDASLEPPIDIQVAKSQSIEDNVLKLIDELNQINGNAGVPARQIKDMSPHGTEPTKEAVHKLTLSGKVVMRKVGGSHLHWVSDTTPITDLQA